MWILKYYKLYIKITEYEKSYPAIFFGVSQKMEDKNLLYIFFMKTISLKKN